MPLDLRLVMRITHIGARRKHGRTTDGLEDELEHLVAAAGQAEAWALTAAAFYEARWNASRKPQRALGYVRKAALLRPQATGYEGLPFPPSLDATWRLTLELSIHGIRSEADVEQWLQALSAIPQHTRETVLADEMNCLTIANRLWIIEAGKSPEQHDWKSVDRGSQAIERWSEAAAVLFAAARRERVVVRGEYEHQLRDAVKMASQVPAFVTADPRAAFILDEIVASQFVYARKYAEADVAFRIALDRAPADSSLLSRTYLKPAQPAGALGRNEAAVELTTRAITAVESDRYRTHTDRPLAHAELALAYWFNGDRNASIEARNRAGEELFAAERQDEQWHGLLVRFHYVGGYFATILHKGSPPPYDGGGNRFIEPKPGAFLIELDTQAPGSNLSVRIGVLLILARMAEGQRNDDRVRRLGCSDR
jgi:tetratricopeptide (TPR) repeat protein